MDKNNILFVNFAFGERTEKLSEYSAKINGFSNYICLDDKVSFHSKLKRFIERSLSSDFDLFIRSDADRIILPGVNELIDFYDKAMTKPWFLQGTGVEYIMNLNRRNATPNIYSRECLEYLNKNFKNVVLNDRKPESAISLHIRDNVNPRLFQSIKTNNPTNLHEFEQHPEKIVNAFLNRLWRGHGGYYKKEYLDALPEVYKAAIRIAVKIHEKKRSSENFKYVETSEILQVNPNFKPELKPIVNVKICYEKYLAQFGR